MCCHLRSSGRYMLSYAVEIWVKWRSIPFCGYAGKFELKMYKIRHTSKYYLRTLYGNAKKSLSGQALFFVQRFNIEVIMFIDRRWRTVWYVIQVKGGTEENIRQQCQNTIHPTVLEKCFIPYYEVMKRYQGKWNKEKKILFPGYVFTVSDEVEELYFELKKVIGLTKILGAGNEVIPLNQEEVDLLRQLGCEEQVVEVSEGVIEGGNVVVTRGPLRGLEGCIRKIDRHKRVAYLGIEMMGRLVETQVGLEIVEKKEW